jgi:hypothetical protein
MVQTTKQYCPTILHAGKWEFLQLLDKQTLVSKAVLELLELKVSVAPLMFGSSFEKTQVVDSVQHCQHHSSNLPPQTAVYSNGKIPSSLRYKDFLHEQNCRHVLAQPHDLSLPSLFHVDKHSESWHALLWVELPTCALSTGMQKALIL